MTNQDSPRVWHRNIYLYSSIFSCEVLGIKQEVMAEDRSTPVLHLGLLYLPEIHPKNSLLSF